MVLQLLCCKAMHFISLEALLALLAALAERCVYTNYPLT
jgi:hypothetical protein